MIGFAAMLFVCALAASLIVTGASSTARAYARFAFGLYAALAAAAVVNTPLAELVALIVSSVAPLLLAFALADALHKPAAAGVASLALAASWVAGVAAAATGLTVSAVAPLSLSVLALIALALLSRRQGALVTIEAIMSACALLAGTSAFVTGGEAGLAGLCAFTSAGLLGTALSLAQRLDVGVEKKSGWDLHRMRTIRRSR